MNYYPLLRRAKAGNRLREPRVQVKGWTGAGCTWLFCRDAPGRRLFAGVPWPLRAQLSSLSVKLGQRRDGLPEPRLRCVSRGRLRRGPGRCCGRPAPGSGAWGVRRLSVLALRPLPPEAWTEVAALPSPSASTCYALCDRREAGSPVAECGRVGAPGPHLV